MSDKINSTLDARDYLINELKKQLVGPGMSNYEYFSNKENDDKNEILNKSPRTIYTAGILFPQGEKNSDMAIEEEVQDDIEIDDDESSSEEKTDKFKSTNNNDEEKVSDNNFDIDLSNELRASSMGLTVVIYKDKPVVFGVKDIGNYKIKKGEKHTKEVLIIASYLSKYKDSYNWFYNNFNLNKNTQGDCHKFIEKIFSIPNIKRSYRDHFDVYYKEENTRKGFRFEKTPKYILQTINELKDISKKDLENKILEIISLKNDKKDEIYKKKDLEQENENNFLGYRRESISFETIFVPNKSVNANGYYSEELIDKNGEKIGLKFSAVIRPHKDIDKYYLTISLVNTNIATKEKVLVDKCFFQCNFYINASNKSDEIFYPFEQINIDKLSEEEKSLHLLHRNRKSYAIGHGCAPTWYFDHNNSLVIKSEVIPVYETKQIKAQEFKDLELNMIKFSEDIDFAISESKKLSEKYFNWIIKEKRIGEKFNNTIFQKESSKNIEKCEYILKRINEGIQILQENSNAKLAFKLMNQSMYLQQMHYKIENYSKKINYKEELKKIKKGNWRPFQLAFILLNIKSFIDPNSEERNIMDLIWFPTGGGKTEAYLGLTSFTIFLRKIISKDIKGCAVLMRYTLRLLTTQQFERAASLICACEFIRRKNVDLLGEEKISLGLWIGKESTPNKEKEALDDYNELYKNPKNTTLNKFILLNCPWCNEKFIKDGEKPKSYKVLKKKFYYVCENQNCSFSKDQDCLPITVIDERIYKEPPTLLIGTIDKFASITWLDEAISMFDNDKFSKPDLVIQDELHLISGPLGSIAGMYEILLTALIEKEVNGKILKAKIIGSTATISRAEKQVKNLYGKICKIFPPQSNQLEDSFFALESETEPGRKYVGVFCASASSPQITQAKVMSSMCLAANEVKIKSGNNSEIYDPYWTNIFYFNSIRELMGGSALIQADVRGNLKGEFYRKGLDKKFMGEKYSKEMRRGIYKPEELTSRIKSSVVPEILKKLEIEHSKDNKNALDICLTTNMIQVGIDIPRLGLMTIVGQPKTTSEYIQASSRVGRDNKKPGLVLTILSPFRPRDRSHYEKFHNYHENIYKFVEPTSITSHSDPVRTRCLHAIIIGLVRLWGDTMRFNPSQPSEDLKQKIKKYILNYVKAAEVDHERELEKTDREIDFIFEKWENLNPQEYGKMVPIGNQSTSSLLMIPAGSEKPPEGDPFETLTSMRNVDKECQAIILTSFKGKL